MDTKIERYVDSAEARAELFAFYAEVYPDAPWLSHPARFEWQSCGNPYLEPGKTEVWLMRDGADRLIGQNIYIPYPLSIGKQQHVGYCSTNLIVRPELVGKGLGHRLIEVNEGRSDVPFAIGITYASERAFLKRGWMLVEDTRLYTRVIRPSRYCTFLNLSGIRKTLTIGALQVAKAAGRLMSLLNVEWRIPKYTFERLDRFDKSQDELWSSFLSDFAIHFERTAELLNYKYFDRPDVTHRVVICKADERIVGYGVFRLSTHPASGLLLGRIVDIVVDPDHGKSLIRELVGYITRELVAMGVDGLVCMGSSPETVSALRINGYLLSRPQHAIIRERDFVVKNLRQQYPLLWFITLGDSDLDNYW